MLLNTIIFCSGTAQTCLSLSFVYTLFEDILAKVVEEGEINSYAVSMLNGIHKNLLQSKPGLDSFLGAYLGLALMGASFGLTAFVGFFAAQKGT